jgi:hypothetical protein
MTFMHVIKILCLTGIRTIYSRFVEHTTKQCIYAIPKVLLIFIETIPELCTFYGQWHFFTGFPNQIILSAKADKVF